jgi:precorrin-3B methylase
VARAADWIAKEQRDEMILELVDNVEQSEELVKIVRWKDSVQKVIDKAATKIIV